MSEEACPLCVAAERAVPFAEGVQGTLIKDGALVPFTGSLYISLNTPSEEP